MNYSATRRSHLTELQSWTALTANDVRSDPDAGGLKGSGQFDLNKYKQLAKKHFCAD